MKTVPLVKQDRPMRVLMSADTVGGVWTYAIELARALAEHDVEVDIATMGGAPSTQQLEDAADHPRIHIHAGNFRLEWMRDPWDDVDAAGRWLLELEDQIRPDIIHLNGYAHAVLPFNSPVLIVAHSCVYSWYHAVHHQSPPAEWKEYHARVARGLRAAAAVTAPTSFMLSELRRHYGGFASAGTIANARRADLFHSRPKEPIVLCVGRVWDEAKNLSLIDNIAARIPWPVYVAGPRRHPDDGTATLRNAVALGNLSARDLAAWYAGAAIFAHPARYEPFGLVVLEAALSGAALVLADIPSLREVWADAACYVDPENSAAWREALTQLIRDADQRRELARRAMARAQRYSPQLMSSAYLRLYRKMLHTASANRASVAARQPGRSLAKAK